MCSGTGAGLILWRIGRRGWTGYVGFYVSYCR